MSSNAGGQGNNISGQGPVDEGAELKETEAPKGPMLLSERPTLVGVSGSKVPVTAPGAPAAPFTKILQLLMTGLAALSLLLLACVIGWQSHHPQSDGYSFRNPHSTRVRTVVTHAPPDSPPAPAKGPANYGNLPTHHGKVLCVLQPALNVDGSQRKHSSVMAISDDGALVATGLEGSALGVWDASTGKIVQILENFPSQPWNILFSTDNKNLIASWGKGTIDVWNIRDNSCKRIVAPLSLDPFSMALSPDGKTLATIDRLDNFMHKIELWDVATRHLKRIFPFKAVEISNLTFSPDGTRLAAVTSIHSQEGQFVLCDLRSNSAPLRHTDPHTEISSLAFSPDNKTLVTGANMMDDHPPTTESDEPSNLYFNHFGEAKLWDSHTLVPIRTIPLHAQPIHLAFSKDSHTLLALELLYSNRVELVDLCGKQQPQLFYPPDECSGTSASTRFAQDLQVYISMKDGNHIRVVRTLGE